MDEDHIRSTGNPYYGYNMFGEDLGLASSLDTITPFATQQVTQHPYNEPCLTAVDGQLYLPSHSSISQPYFQLSNDTQQIQQELLQQEYENIQHLKQHQQPFQLQQTLQLPSSPQYPPQEKQEKDGQSLFTPEVPAPAITIQPLPTLEEIHQTIITQGIQLDALKNRQRMLAEELRIGTKNMQTLQAEVEHIRSEQRRIDTEIGSLLESLKDCYQNNVLSPPDLHRVFCCITYLKLHDKQLQLLVLELRSFFTEDPEPIPALMIVEQPFPDVIPKNKQLSGNSLVVKLLCGAATQITNISPVKATLISEGLRNPQEKTLEFDVQYLDSTLTAQFPLKFIKGSRKSKAKLRFSVQLTVQTRYGPRFYNIESEYSQPFIVITNEAQWENSQELLLKQDAFNNLKELPLSQFLNTLQKHFIRATKQDLHKPQRPLSVHDFDYIIERINNRQRSIISIKEFESFWSWFGKTLQVIRYQRHINAMWQAGLLYGMMTRKSVDNTIIEQEAGTFIIRFSEKYPGQFGIAYKALGSEQPKHYLVSTNDILGARKTLPDFVMEQKSYGMLTFTHILQLKVDPTNCSLQFLRLPKQQAFAQYRVQLPSENRQESEDGYEPLC